MKNSVKRTNTTLFLLPLLGESKQTSIDDHEFINAYLKENNIYIKYSDWDQTIQFNEEIEKVIELFIKGLYSQIPNNYKQKILDFWELKKDSRLHSILYPKQYMYKSYSYIPKICEIWPKPDMSIETI